MVEDTVARDDIIRMAREAGISRLPDNWGDGWWQADSTAELERFAALIAAAERSACAQVCEAMRPSKEEFDQRYYAGCTDSASAIRARGEK